jgi:hypothetical protein
MHRALFLLIRLQFKGWFRRQFTGGSARRFIFGILGALLFLLWFSSMAVGAAFQRPRSPDEILSILPLYLTAFALLPLVMGVDDRAISFTPAEIDFLFPGPFSRRDLVLYKMVKLAIGSAAGGVFFALVLRQNASTFLSGLAGAVLALLFINLLTTIVALARDALQESVYTSIRRLATAALIALVGGAVWLATRSGAPTLQGIRELADTTPIRIALAPARLFAHVFASASLLEAIPWVAACLGMITAAGAGVLAMDKGYLEAALAASQRRQARLARMRRGVAIPTGKNVRSLSIPGLSGLGPFGAIVKRQAVTAFRTSRGWMIAFAAAVAYGYFLSRIAGKSGGAPAVAGLVPIIILMLTMLPQMLRFDFRGDLDQMDHLKSLPASSGVIALAELSVPTVVLCVEGWLILLAARLFMSVPNQPLILGALAIPPAVALVMALENFVFLLVPTRLFAAGQGSMAFSGRRLLMVLARSGLILVGGGLVTLIGVAAWFATSSIPITFAACWLTLWLIVAGMILAVAWAFARFDVSLDMPV